MIKISDLFEIFMAFMMKSTTKLGFGSVFGVYDGMD